MKTLNLFVAIGCILTLPACSIKNTIQKKPFLLSIHTISSGPQAEQELAFLLIMKVRLLLTTMFWMGR